VGRGVRMKSDFEAVSEQQVKPMRFYTVYSFEVDSKRRVQVPAKWRPPVIQDGGRRMAAIEVEFMLTLTRVRGDSCACITAMPAEVFEAYAQKVDGLPLLDPAAERLRRFLGSRSEPVEMDASGRITLPKWMADKVGIGQKSEHEQNSTTVVLRGEVDRFSIWSKQKFDADEIENQKEDDRELESQI
jgi:division/cell wall cluster transcriptional repressor MraZ